ncbi:MAG: serine/threonine protein kinase [Deltaproteobacteria bacterium]|nr:serine/threonine protein kinase [Deltaproteobacteria bacterium]
MTATPPRPRIETPAAVFGDYLLLRREGIGGMAEVFRAQRRDRRPGDPDLALKRLLPHIAEDPTLARLYLREVEALRRIDHPVVVRLVDAGEVDGVPYVAMPWLGGLSLRQVLADGPDGAQAPLPVELALHLGAELADGLGAAHATGVVHRDVSPSNVLISDAGDVHLIDFGIARVAGLAQTTHGQGLRGKWAYAAPEQIAGLPIDGRTDLFSLGSVVVEALLGKAPFAEADREATLARIQTAVPARWPALEGSWVRANAVLHALLRKEPADRPQDGAALAHLLRGVLEQADFADPAPLRQALADRVAARRRARPEASTLQAAELRGEDVTRPDQDRDATEVRMA